MNFPKIKLQSGMIHAHLGYGHGLHGGLRYTTLCEMGFPIGDDDPNGAVDCPYCLQVIRAVEGKAYDSKVHWQPDQVILLRANSVAHRRTAAR